SCATVPLSTTVRVLALASTTTSPLSRANASTAARSAGSAPNRWPNSSRLRMSGRPAARPSTRAANSCASGGRSWRVTSSRSVGCRSPRGSAPRTGCLSLPGSGTRCCSAISWPPGHVRLHSPYARLAPVMVRAAAVGVAEDQLAEAAVLFVFVEKRVVVLVERSEPLVPADLFELVLGAEAGIVDAQQARVIAAPGFSDARRAPSALLDPPAHRLVIGCGLRTLRLCHARRWALRVPGIVVDLERPLQRADRRVDAVGGIAQTREAIGYGVDRECRRIAVGDLVPVEGRRHPRVVTRPNRVRRGGGVILGVLVVVDEDAVALLFP